MYARILKMNPNHDPKTGEFTFGKGTGTKALQKILANVSQRNLVGGVFTKNYHDEHFKELGYSDSEIKEFHDRLLAHTRDHTQVAADKDIESNLNKNTRFGQYLKDRADLEEAIMDQAAANVDKELAAEKVAARKDFETDKKLGISSYNPEYDGTEEEFIHSHYHLGDAERSAENAKNPTFYRKGDLSKAVISTTQNPNGANTGYLGGGTTIKPDHKWTRSELKKLGYRPVAGFSALYGYVGEGEVLFLKMK